MKINSLEQRTITIQMKVAQVVEVAVPHISVYNRLAPTASKSLTICGAVTMRVASLLHCLNVVPLASPATCIARACAQLGGHAPFFRIHSEIPFATPSLEVGLRELVFLGEDGTARPFFT